MALIGMAIYSTKENGKDEYLNKTLKSLFKTVDFRKHRLMLSVNARTNRTNHLLNIYSDIISEVIYNDTNLGTAEAINQVWRKRMPGEHAVKMDDDIVIHNPGWLDDLEYIANRNTDIGQIGLKRKDCIESPWRQDFYKSELEMLVRAPGERWIIIEKANHIMGSCVLHSDALLNKIGYLWQPGLYGFDDSFMSLRSKLAGFKNAFLPHVEIDHIDPGTTDYQKWKENAAGEKWQAYQNNVQAFSKGVRPLYYNPFV
jgi:GT2 family glycosyltransferase